MKLNVYKGKDNETRWKFDDCDCDSIFHYPSAMTWGSNSTHRQNSIIRWMTAIYDGFGIDELPLGEEMQIMNPQKASDYNTVVRAGVVLWNIVYQRRW